MISKYFLDSLPLKLRKQFKATDNQETRGFNEPINRRVVDKQIHAAFNGKEIILYSGYLVCSNNRQKADLL